MAHEKFIKAKWVFPSFLCTWDGKIAKLGNFANLVMTFILKLSRDALSITYLTLHLPFLLKSRLEILWVQFVLALLTPEELPARLSKMMLSKRYCVTCTNNKFTSFCYNLCYKFPWTLTLCLSVANNMDALWNLQSGFFGSVAMALLSVARALSDFLQACCTWKEQIRRHCYSDSQI